ncbi:MAG: carboxypeptidase-like regulatory domain-containing protein [Saprospiraceae bacterium]|nr:carboxypeptidase-like regulatory domain-containing protein [Saprospiraceae bacterium]
MTDKKGIPLPYASVYQENTTKGTVCNEEGEYIFYPSDDGKITLCYQYVGYKKKTIEFQYAGQVILRDVILEEDDAMIDEIVILANREDPAYPIIRKAIEKREFHRKQVKSFEAALYTKGLIKLLDAPEKFMGQEIKDMGGILDSLRRGIIYLSESKSTFYFTQPNRTKEVMISTKKSGDNSLFTANQFSLANINLYDNYIEMGRSVISPIGDNAISFYKYTLIKADIDESGRTIYKIKVDPKYSNEPLFKGYVYIVGDSWNFYSTEVSISGKNLKVPLMDSIRFHQIYLPAPSGEWLLFSQSMYFKGDIFGFSIGGNFTYIFSEHQVNKDLSQIFSAKETFRVNKDALKQDSAYWANNRPVPLTVEENSDYQKKDSLFQIWNSKEYQDSIDRISNRFKLQNILLGYSYSNRYKNYSINYPVPLSLVRFNVVEGWNIYFQPDFTKTDSTSKYWIVRPLINYGFSDKKWKTSALISRRYSLEMLGEISVEFGRKYDQYDENLPILLKSNTWSSLFYKLNYIRLYDKRFVKLSYQREIVNSLFIKTYAEIAERLPLEKKSDFSFFYTHRIYDENIPNYVVPDEIYTRHKTTTFSLELRWTPGQTYSSYPNLRIRNTGKYPVFRLYQKTGIPFDKNIKAFYTAGLSIEKSRVNLARYGYFSYYAEVAGSIINRPYYFQDYLHPLGNEWVIPDGNRPDMFYLLPYYSYSTDRYFSAFHFKHHFNGFIMDKIPLLKRTSLKTVFSANYIYNPKEKHYFETGIGIENIIIGQIPAGSIEYFWSWSSYLPNDRGFIIKLLQVITN